ncbi:MAG: DNA-formamidopyrimidine glycosylase [Ignavibacteriaceae bacterium]
MPELPEVESFRKYFHSNALNKKIKNAEVESSKMLGKISSKSLQKNLKGSNFKSTKRHGKNLFAELNNNKWLLLHFGMSGFLKYYKNKSEAPKHIRLLIDFENGWHLAFDDLRKFGKIDLVDDADGYIKKKKLGADPIEDKISFKKFYELLQNKKGTIKSILLNQQIIAGIGNLYSDEILFQAGIHPGLSIKKIKENEFKNIYNKMNSVLKKAISVKADENKFPKSYLFVHRKTGDDCPKCSGEIDKKTIAGRTSYFCKKHQKKK